MSAYMYTFRQGRMSATSLEYDNGVLVYRTPYMPALVAELKLQVQNVWQAVLPEALRSSAQYNQGKRELL